jgi:hypothetical protein
LRLCRARPTTAKVSRMTFISLWKETPNGMKMLENSSTRFVAVHWWAFV